LRHEIRSFQRLCAAVDINADILGEFLRAFLRAVPARRLQSPAATPSQTCSSSLASEAAALRSYAIAPQVSMEIYQK
jgi:hypothetical protein